MPDNFQYVKMPDGSYGKFRADASDDIIRKVITTRFPDAFKGSFGSDAASKATGISANPDSGTLAGRIDTMRQQLQQRLSTGSQSGAGEFMGSIPLGVLGMAKGAAQTAQGRAWEGAKNVVGGLLQSLTMPSMVAAPEGAGAAAAAADSAIPNAARAGRSFEDIQSVVGKHAVDITENMNKSLLRIQQLAERGGSGSNLGPVPVRKLFMRITDPERGPLTYEEARDFYSNITRMSADEFNKLTPVVKRAVGQFTKDFNDAILATASHAGKGEQYSSAMREFSKALQMRDMVGKAGRWVAKASPYAGGVGTGVGVGYAVKKLIE